MRAITIRLPDVEPAMLDEVRKRDKRFVDIQAYLQSAIRDAYAQRCIKGLTVIHRCSPFAAHCE